MRHPGLGLLTVPFTTGYHHQGSLVEVFVLSAGWLCFRFELANALHLDGLRKPAITRDPDSQAVSPFQRSLGLLQVEDPDRSTERELSWRPWMAQHVDVSPKPGGVSDVSDIDHRQCRGNGATEKYACFSLPRESTKPSQLWTR